MSDPYCETFGFGADITFPYDNLPICTNHLIQSVADIDALKLFDVYISKRTKNRIDAVVEFKRQTGDEYPILGWVEGALAEATDLCGMTELSYMLFDAPEAVEKMLDICAEQAILFAQAQIKAGADIIGVGDAAASVFGPEVYRTYVKKCEQRICQAIQQMGAIARLHICGNITPLLEDIKEVGFDIVDVDWMVDFAHAKHTLGEKTAVCGNFDPVSVMKQGTVDLIMQSVKQCADVGGANSIIMAGCEIPIDTPLENMLAVHKACAQYN
jgi:uroporphyrinogen decarboxylase